MVEPNTTSIPENIKLIIEKLGSNASSGSYRRMFKEIHSRYLALIQIRTELLKTNGSNAQHLQYIESEIAFVTKFSKRLVVHTTHNQKTDYLTEWNRYFRENTLKLIRSNVGLYSYKRSDTTRAQYIRSLGSTKRKNYYCQKISYEIAQASSKGWYLVFDTLTLADDCANNVKPSDIGMYFKKYAKSYKAHIVQQLRAKYERMTENQRAAEFEKFGIASVTPKRGKPRKPATMLNELVHKALPDQSEYYRWVCIPEFGTENGRLHWHAIHMIKHLSPIQNHKLINGKFTPVGAKYSCSTDPNLGHSRCNRTEINAFKQLWDFGLSNPIAVRYHNDSFSRKLNWLSVKTEKNGILAPEPLRDHGALANYLSKYVGKATDQSNEVAFTDMNNDSQLRQNYQITASRGFGFFDLTGNTLTTDELLKLSNITHELTDYSALVSAYCKKQLKKRLPDLTVQQIEDLIPNDYDFMASVDNALLGKKTKLPDRYLKTPITDISPDCIQWLKENKLHVTQRPKQKSTHFAGK